MYGKMISVIALSCFVIAILAVIFILLPFPWAGAVAVTAMILSAGLSITILWKLRKQKNQATWEANGTDAEIADCPEETITADIQKPVETLPAQAEPLSVLPSELQEGRDKFNAISRVLRTFSELIAARQSDPETARKEGETLIRNMTFITENIKKAFDIADNLSLSAKNAFSVSEKVQTGIKAVTAALKEALEFATTLFEQSQQIHGIIGILSDISSRINILSINASIVSARAGVHGRPFEVVAREIRKLAEETDKSLSKISDQITSIIAVIGDVVAKINMADAQTEQEKDALLAVVGSLQGITLGVEVFRAVSKSAKEKSIDQTQGIDALTESSIKISDQAARLAAMEREIQTLLQDINPRGVT